ncbi:lytic transglycosylase domain-containing protein [Nocardia callitridis]|uniref:Transglycosylase SLT domain-containing protein n=1 Tax=Nocardia callitridis TaxID=648753 RepID=A0ABP9JRU1_9NOCA
MVVAGLVASGSAAHIPHSDTPPTAPEAHFAASDPDGPENRDATPALSKTVGLLPVSPEAPRKLRAMKAPGDGAPLFAGTVPLGTLELPRSGGALGIPEIVLAAYRNAELALASTMPGCGVSWSLLAGIGRIESGHASGGHTDAAGTTTTPIYGPTLDGTLPDNEVIRSADGGYVRAVGPMQFLPSTWTHYASDGNGDGVADPNNVFDAALGAGKYLCSGGMNLRDPAQELRAVLRYNNSMSYAANVLGWSASYRSGGTTTPGQVTPGIIPPGSIPQGPDMSAANTTKPPTTPQPEQTPPRGLPQQRPQTPAPELMIRVPGLPPIPCGILCPPPPPKPSSPCEPDQLAIVPAPMPRPGQPQQTLSPAQTYGSGVDPNSTATPTEPESTDSSACMRAIGPDEAAPDQTGHSEDPTQQTDSQSPATTMPESEAQQSDSDPSEPTITTEPAPSAEPAPMPPPALTLPFGIVVPLPAAQG